MKNLRFIFNDVLPPPQPLPSTPVIPYWLAILLGETLGTFVGWVVLTAMKIPPGKALVVMALANVGSFLFGLVIWALCGIL